MMGKLSVIVFAVMIVAGILVRTLPEPLARGFSSSVAVYDTHGSLLRLTLSGDDKYRLWLPLRQYSPTLVEAVLLHEDRHFYRHAGVNPYAFFRAFARTYLAGSRRIGGSTITMQLARLMYRIHTRSPWGKLKQIVRALQLEFLYSKDDILEAYLNLIPFGQNVEGAAAASLIYFGTTVDKLSLSEALTLAVMPQSPALRANRLRGVPSLVAARKRLFTRFLAARPVSADAALALDAPPVMKTLQDLPFLAPHFTTSLLAKAGTTIAIHSTLDLTLQQLMERHAKSYIARHQRNGIQNASALLLDYRTMEVKALLGSVDFFNDAIQGQVNGTTAKRSPGSALKPFVYAMALDQGLIHPMTVLTDVPFAVGAFNPENFDGRFIGPLTATEALIRSRNIPAVALATRLVSPTYYEFLKMTGISRMRSEQHYGPSLVIGGFEVTMEEVATLYAMLANQGVFKPLRYRLTDPPEPTGVPLLSSEASYMILDMLQRTPRPDDRYESEWTPSHLPIAWKTGTSYGFRDAWTAGIFGPYILVVWVGNFSGEANPSLIGIRAAAPLFFQLADAIRIHHGGLREPLRKIPPHLNRVEVCAVSGGLPGAFCDRTTRTHFIPGKSPIQGCDVHRQVFIDTRTGLQACGPNTPHARAEVYEFWPSDVLKVFQKAGIPRRTPPAWDSRCSLDTPVARGHPPAIISPHEGVTYTLRVGDAAHTTIAFSASTDFDAREIFWFVNDSYVGKALSSGALLWSAVPGDYIIRAVDEMGRADSRPLTVVLAP